MISLDNVGINFKDKIIIRNASTKFKGACVHALIGRNGAGKSTLLRAMAGIGKIDSGRISIAGNDIKSLSASTLGRLIAFVTTEKIRIPRFTCREIVALGRAPYTDWIGRITEKDSRIIDRSLSLVGMSDFAERTMETMSDGECQRVMIARALAQDTPAILLDEPTSFLDLPSRYELCRLLRNLAHEEEKCILYSSHELDIVLSLTDSIAMINNGELIHMPTEEMKSSGIITEVFNL